jgi:pre-mRNA-splicing factor ATP-dependent RNA helicase DHX15/PRP43
MSSSDSTISLSDTTTSDIDDNKPIGVLDPEGKNDNPLTEKPYSDKYRELAKFWSNFPAYKNATKTIKAIRENSVILVRSPTGSGKTVVVPKYVLHVYNYNKKIAVILPRQIITKSAAEFAAETLDVELGKEVGFRHRGEKNYDPKLTKMLYTTDGTLAQMVLGDPMLKEFSAVIIDEAHERRVQTDFLLYLLKNVALNRPDFKLIIMSATVDEKIFANYFTGTKYTSLSLSGITNYPITPVFSPKSVEKSKYIEFGLERIKEILRTTKEGDILFFVPNIQETFNVCQKIMGAENLCIEFYAGMNKEKENLAKDKDLYKEKYKGKTRKIIIATNVAESSITFDGIKFVIDSGYENKSYFDPKIGSKVLDKQMASKAQIKQRCGRTGRTGHGICYHLYTSIDYNKLDDYPQPSIQTSDISTEALSLLTWPTIQTTDELERVLLDFIEPPKKEYIDYAKNLFLKLGLTENGKITPLGTLISNLPADPMQGVAIYEAWKLNCAKEVISIIVLCDIIKYNISELFFFSKNEDDPKKIKKFENAKKSLFHQNSDHYTLLKIFKQYKKLKKQSEEKLNEWLSEHYLKKNILEKADVYYKKMKSDILRRIQKNKDNVGSNEEKKDSKLKQRILQALSKGYIQNVAFLGSYGYQTDKVKNARISKDSWMVGKEKKRIIYSEMFTTGGNSYLQIVSAISKEKSS